MGETVDAAIDEGSDDLEIISPEDSLQTAEETENPPAGTAAEENHDSHDHMDHEGAAMSVDSNDIVVDPPMLATARPLLPSVDLSGHNGTSFVVHSTEAKHFGTYACTASY